MSKKYKNKVNQKPGWGTMIFALALIALGLFSSKVLFEGRYFQGGTGLFRLAEGAAPETGSFRSGSDGGIVIEFGNLDFYSVWIKDGEVIGGHAQGSAYWEILGGVFDGQNLQLIMVTDDQDNCNEWWSHNFFVESSQVTLRTSVNKCGEAIVEQDVVYPRTGLVRPIQMKYIPSVFAPNSVAPTMIPAEETLIFGDSESYYVRIVDEEVVSGYAQGSADWEILSGVYDGINLQIIMTTPDRSNCYEWWSHNFIVEDSQVTLRTSVNKCGEAIVDRNVVYPRTDN